MASILVIGASGMLGHRLWLDLSKDHHVVGTLRTPNPVLASWASSSSSATLESGFDALDFSGIESLIEKLRPDFVINAVGAIKQYKTMSSENMIQLNALLPWRLADACRSHGAKLILVSTDCVFDGEDGNYLETDPTNAKDLYGRSKALGEVTDRDDVLTLRTSIIGRELRGDLSLVEWFLEASKSQQEISGFSKAMYSGLPTHTLAQCVQKIIEQKTFLSGLFHISSEPIDKFSLLQLLARKIGYEGEVVPKSLPVVERSLNSEKLRSAVDFEIPSRWEELIEDLMIDFKKYEQLKNK